MKIIRIISIAAISVVAAGLGSCGGSSGTSSAPVENTDPAINILTTPNTPIDNAVALNDSSVNQPSTDFESGGFIGNPGPIRSSIALPDDPTGLLLGVATKEMSTIAIEAHFGYFATSQQLYEYLSDYTRPLDSCHRTDIDAFNGFSSNLYPPNFAFTHISAGEILPISGPFGSLGELEFEGKRYRLADAILPVGVPAVSEIFISAPGAEFPGFGITSFPQSERLVGFRANNEIFLDINDGFNPKATPDLSWEASNDADTFIHIEFFADIPATDDYEENSIAFNCTLEDDGAFTFPPEILALYTAEPFNSELKRPVRLKVKQVETTGGIMLLVNENYAG